MSLTMRPVTSAPATLKSPALSQSMRSSHSRTGAGVLTLTLPTAKSSSPIAKSTFVTRRVMAAGVTRTLPTLNCNSPIVEIDVGDVARHGSGSCGSDPYRANREVEFANVEVDASDVDDRGGHWRDCDVANAEVQFPNVEGNTGD